MFTVLNYRRNICQLQVCLINVSAHRPLSAFKTQCVNDILKTRVANMPLLAVTTIPNPKP